MESSRRRFSDYKLSMEVISLVFHLCPTTNLSLSRSWHILCLGTSTIKFSLSVADYHSLHEFIHHLNGMRRSVLGEIEDSVGPSQLESID